MKNSLFSLNFILVNWLTMKRYPDRSDLDIGRTATGEMEDEQEWRETR